MWRVRNLDRKAKKKKIHNRLQGPGERIFRTPVERLPSIWGRSHAGRRGVDTGLNVTPAGGTKFACTGSPARLEKDILRWR